MLWGEYNYDEDIAAQRQEAFDDGIQQGELQKAIETAKNMLVNNISIDVIVDCTGLTIEEVQELSKQ